MSGFSRRGLLGQSAAFALAPAIARAATGTLAPQSPSPLIENIQGAPDAQDRLMVETYVNGKGPYGFVVDTGAERSVISEELARDLGLHPGADVIVQGIARAVTAPAVHLTSLRMGSVAIRSLPMPVLPRAWLAADGYLGLDVINHQSVTFDFLNRSLTVQPPDAAVVGMGAGDEDPIRVSGSDGKLTSVNCSVDGARAVAFIDSGAEISIGNSKLFEAMSIDGGRYLNSQVVEILGVTGGSAAGRMTFVDRIKLGPINFLKSVLVISDLEVFDVWGLADQPALFIGMNFLRQTSSVTIDYGRKELRFKLAQMRMASRA